MKTILLYITLLISGLAMAQNTINYKAIIKDGSGNVLANENIRVRFTIINTTESATVYQERYLSVDTNDSGLIILEIGGGLPSVGFYTDINWSDGDLYGLQVEIDLFDGNGYIDMGTNDFNTVPFAQAASSIMKLPTRTLEVTGIGDQKIRIHSENGNEAAIELMRTGLTTDWKIEHSDTWLDIITSDDDFSSEEIKFTFREDGKLGVNTFLPAEELHVNGTIRSTDLSGSGNRKVLANAQGNLVIDTETKYISLNPTAFHAKTPSGTEAGTTIIRGLAMSGQSGDKVFQANVNIPHGATMRNIWVHFVDSSTISDITIKLERRLLNSNAAPVLIFDTATSGGSTAIRLLTAPALLIIPADNFTYSYYIKVQSTSWQNNQYVKGIVISYTE